MADKPKITGLSFNIYAIVGLLVILPISTALVTNLGNANNTDYQNIMNEEDFIWNDPYLCDVYNFDDYTYIDWYDGGDNSTSQYESYYGLTNADYTKMDESVTYKHTGGCNNFYYKYGSDIFHGNGADNHEFLESQSFKFTNPAWEGYIGYSGNDFSFKIDNNLFRHIDQSQDISGFKFTFIDNNLGVACDNAFFRNLTFDYEITLIDENNSLSKFYTGFSDTQKNSYYIDYDVYNQQNNYCVEGLTLDYDFSPLESIELNDYFNNNWDELSALVRVYNIQDEFNLNYSVGVSDLVFTGTGSHQTLTQVRFVDLTQTNLIFSGGTFLIGVALFALALASTPYWNPITNALKPKGGM